MVRSPITLSRLRPASAMAQPGVSRSVPAVARWPLRVWLPSPPRMGRQMLQKASRGEAVSAPIRPDRYRAAPALSPTLPDHRARRRDRRVLRRRDGVSSIDGESVLPIGAVLCDDRARDLAESRPAPQIGR